MTPMVEVLIGTIGRAHGLRGDVTVFCRTDEPDVRFAAGATVHLDTGPVRVLGFHWQSDAMIVRFAGVNDRTAAEALRGKDIWARVAAEEEPADVNEYYDRALIGLEVRDHLGASVGSVAGVMHLPAQDVLQVRTALGEKLVPFVAELVPVVDLAQGFLQVAAVGGLIDDAVEEAR